MSKYQSRKTTVNGIEFDSKKESARYKELLLLEKAGAIQNLQRQVPFELIPTQTTTVAQYSKKTGKRLKDKTITLERKTTYVADFVYIQDGKQIVEDTKGVRTDDYIIKRKLMLLFNGIRIREV